MSTPSPLSSAAAAATPALPTRRAQRAVPGWSVAGLLGLAAAWAAGEWLRRQGDGDIAYWLGVAGGVAMLTLFAYPLRKRWRLLQRLGRTRGWFVFHMAMGLAGPWLILVHCGFRLGSLNATVALLSRAVSTTPTASSMPAPGLPMSISPTMKSTSMWASSLSSVTSRSTSASFPISTAMKR